MNVALFKGNMKPEEKAANLRSFKVHYPSSRLQLYTELRPAGRSHALHPATNIVMDPDWARWVRTAGGQPVQRAADG